MSSFDSELHEIHPKTAAGWRTWLAKNHARCDGVWLVDYRGPSAWPAALAALEGGE